MTNIFDHNDPYRNQRLRERFAGKPTDDVAPVTLERALMDLMEHCCRYGRSADVLEQTVYDAACAMTIAGRSHRMKPIDPKTEGLFVNFAADQPEYHPLPARVQEGIVHTRWRPTWRERLAVLFGRCVDIELMTFGRPLQPILPYVQGMEPKEEPVRDSEEGHR